MRQATSIFVFRSPQFFPEAALYRAKHPLPCRPVPAPITSAPTRASFGGGTAASQAGALLIAKTVIYRKETRIALDLILEYNQRAKVAVVWWRPLHQLGERLVLIELTSGTSCSTCASLRSR